MSIPTIQTQTQYTLLTSPSGEVLVDAQGVALRKADAIQAQVPRAIQGRISPRSSVDAQAWRSQWNALLNSSEASASMTISGQSRSHDGAASVLAMATIDPLTGQIKSVSFDAELTIH
jgi:hypothetical protein